MEIIKWLSGFFSTNTSDGVLIVMLFVIVLGGIGYGLIKFVESMKKTIEPTNVVTSADILKLQKSLEKFNSDIDSKLTSLSESVRDLQEINNNILSKEDDISSDIDDIDKVIEEIKSNRQEDLKTLIPIKKDMESLLNEVKQQNSELTNQIVQLQKDLASLHGTVIGISTTRSKLK